MKNNFLFAALAASLIVASCNKSNEYPYPSKVETVNTVPDISLSRTDGLNLYEVGDTSKFINVTFNTNVPVISDAADAVTGSGRNFNPIENPEYCDCGYMKTGAIGRNEYLFSHGGNTDYTQDLEFYLVQSAWNEIWYDYSPYGYIETPVTFRIRGKKGTAILPDDWTAYKIESSRPHYLKGEVKSIKETGDDVIPFATIKHFANIFKEINFTPASDSQSTDKIIIAIFTDNGLTYDIPVQARKRDYEKTRLLNYIKVGDIIEVPAVVADEKAFEKQGNHPEIKAVTADKVLLLSDE